MTSNPSDSVQYQSLLPTSPTSSVPHHDQVYQYTSIYGATSHDKLDQLQTKSFATQQDMREDSPMALYASPTTGSNLVHQAYQTGSTLSNSVNRFASYSELDAENVFFRAGYGNIIWTIICWTARFLTGGLSTPFLDYWYYRKYVQSIRFSGYRVVLKATLFDFCMLNLLHYALTLVSGCLYLFIMDYITALFVDSRMEWEWNDAPNMHAPHFRRNKNPKMRFFSSKPSFITDFFFSAGMILSFGLAYPWLMKAYYRRWFSNARVDGNRIRCNFRAIEFFSLYLRNWVLNVVTFGLWHICGCGANAMCRYLDSKIEWY